MTLTIIVTYKPNENETVENKDQFEDYFNPDLSGNSVFVLKDQLDSVGRLINNNGKRI